jgi:hypothetical protein
MKITCTSISSLLLFSLHAFGRLHALSSGFICWWEATARDVLQLGILWKSIFSFFSICLTWVLHVNQGWNCCMEPNGVGFCIHCIASQLDTMYTSGLETISSRNLWGETKLNMKLDLRFHILLENSYNKGPSIEFLFKPNSMEVKSERCTVWPVMSVEVVHQHVISFFFRIKLWTIVHHSTGVFLKNILIHS